MEIEINFLTSRNFNRWGHLHSLYLTNETINLEHFEKKKILLDFKQKKDIIF